MTPRDPDMPSAPKAAIPVFGDFAGLWHLRRQISEFRGGQSGRFEGTATFTPDAAGHTAYTEEGILRLGDGMPLRATRDYRWRFAAGRIAVDYADGRPFHSFDPAHPQAEHLCGPDLYHVTYDFARWPLWRALWVVRGPHKDYRMISDYSRPDPRNDPQPLAPGGSLG